MAFLGVYRAVYDYVPVGEGELALVEGDLLFVLEKSSEDSWWKAKKKSSGDDAEEPEGLIPNNYIEEAAPVSQARALYDYNRQTDEEVSFTENASLNVYDTTDPDWTLIGYAGEYGFAPSNYIEFSSSATASSAYPSAPQAYESHASSVPSPLASPQPSAAATLAGLIHQKTGQPANVQRAVPVAQYTPEESEEDAAPSLPQRPMMMSPPITAPRSPEPAGVMASRGFDDNVPSSPGGFHLYHVHEMISSMGRKKKLPTTLGLDLAKGIIMISPEKSKDGPGNQWTADKLSNYSIEGKHVFIELIRPSKSVDFHAGSKDTAEEITRSLGELAGAARAEGLREVIAASNGSGQKKGHMLYEFMAQGEDEVTVAVGDEVVVLDDTASDEWWMVRRVKNGKQGVVPSSYVEITGAAGSSVGGGNSGRSVVEQNRMDEERLTKEASSRSSKQERSSEKRREGRSTSGTSKSKPDPSRTRTWTDTSGTFKVEAEFLGFKDGKIHLHKVNGVKIAVPVGKMSLEDIEYVERATGQVLDDHKPLSEIKKRGAQRSVSQTAPTTSSSAGARVERPQPPPESKYDWFDFFLQCGVSPQTCERYSAAFDREEMGEENMEGINPQLLRTLGLKEGDILRVMKFLDARFGRARANGGGAEGETANGDSGGLFSGPGGALKNNTRKGRPAPAMETSDTVDGQAFQAREAPPPQSSGFDDDAWDVKPSYQQAAPPTAPPLPSVTQSRPPPVGAMSELSLLAPPLVPTPAPAPPQAPQQPLQPQATGADRSFFDQVSQQSAAAQARSRPSAPFQQSQASFLPPPPSRSQSVPQNFQQSAFSAPLMPQMTGFQGQPAPSGQSMNDQMQRLQMQQRYSQMMQAQQTGYGQMPGGIIPQPTGFGQFQQAQPTGFGQFPLQPQATGYPQAVFLNGQQTGSPFADPPRAPFQPQPTGFGQQQAYGLPPQSTGINSFLPPALQPQPTGINGFQASLQPQQTGFQQTTYQPLQPQATSFLPMTQNGFGQMPTTMQQQQQQQAPAPLMPQKTGPAPPVRFGMNAAQKLMAQPTGRRANLASATPQNPFGF